MDWKRATLAILIGGVAAGSIDIFAAALINRVGAGVILQAIASGVLGSASFSGGTRTMVIGLLLQWFMSLIIAAVYAVSALKLTFLARRPALFGALYGVGIFIVMNFVVVPLSLAARRPHHFSAAYAAKNLAAMILFGLVIASTVHAADWASRRAHD